MGGTHHDISNFFRGDLRRIKDIGDGVNNAIANILRGRRFVTGDHRFAIHQDSIGIGTAYIDAYSHKKSLKPGNRM